MAKFSFLMLVSFLFSSFLQADQSEVVEIEIEAGIEYLPQPVTFNIGYGRLLIPIANSDKNLLIACRNGFIGNLVYTDKKSLKGITGRFLTGEAVFEDFEGLSTKYYSCDQLASQLTILTESHEKNLILRFQDSKLEIVATK